MHPERITSDHKWKAGLFSAYLVSVTLISSLNMGCHTKENMLRNERIHKSPQWDTDRFVNRLPRKEASRLEMLHKFIMNDRKTVPEKELPIVTRNAADFAPLPEKQLRVTWFGHSTLMMEIDGVRLLVDPVWSNRPSPVPFFGLTRFHPPPLPITELKKIQIDAVVISHDHYDHLDKDTIAELRDMPLRFIVPLGVGTYLEDWGVDPLRITELDWWEDTQIGGVKITATPARHFSGRSFFSGNWDRTLWSGWAFQGPGHRVFYSGDTAMFPEFREIGHKLGPFDLTIIEIGAYNAMWSDVHIGPEQAIQAHKMLQGRYLLPVHWGTFDLALHSWTEPIERLVEAASKEKVTVFTPRPGETIDADDFQSKAAGGIHRWWPAIPWQRAREAPIVSTGLEAVADYGLTGESAEGF